MTSDPPPPRIEFIWDFPKAASNIAKHGVAFPQAATVFSDALAVTLFDDEHSDAEDRWFTLGRCSEGRLLVVSHTYATLAENQSRVRIISARSATRNERRQYENNPR